MTRRTLSIVAGTALVLCAACAAVLLNLLLLGHAGRPDRTVGHLKVDAGLPSAPAWTLRPAQGRIEDRFADD
jgi:hypothetical protein